MRTVTSWSRSTRSGSLARMSRQVSTATVLAAGRAAEKIWVRDW